VLPPDYLDFIAAARQDAEPFRVPWPMPDNPSSFPAFTTFAEWRAFVLQFSLHPTLPHIVSAKFERAQKLYILTWIDFDLIKAGELMALTALELALTDRYAGKEIERRRKIINKKAEEEKRNVRKGEKWWAENPSFADLLKYTVDYDGLTEDQIPLNRRCGPPSKVLGMVTGETSPSLWDIRNDLAHGVPLNEAPWAGLPELVRDLINYAYRDWTSRRL
jgi:hypothetical protein